MKWYKHDTSAHRDAKLRKVMIKYGMEGYGLYWYCLELIVENISLEDLTFELEHDSEVISHDTGIHRERVEEMMTYMVDLGLFENRHGSLTCWKLLKRLDQSMTSSPKMREMIEAAKVNHDKVMTLPDFVMQEQNRTEQNRTDNKIGQKRPASAGHFDRFWGEYPKKVKKKTALEIWKRKRLDPRADELIQDVTNRLQNDGRWIDGYVPDPTTYLNQERWDDEITTRKQSDDDDYITRMGRIGNE